MTEPHRIRPEVAEPVVQDGRSREDARRAEREAALLDEHPAPLHDLDDDADDEEGATWVHLLCDHGYGPHSLDDANLAELRAHHADAHEADADAAARLEGIEVGARHAAREILGHDVR